MSVGCSERSQRCARSCNDPRRRCASQEHSTEALRGSASREHFAGALRGSTSRQALRERHFAGGCVARESVAGEWVAGALRRGMLRMRKRRRRMRRRGKPPKGKCRTGLPRTASFAGKAPQEKPRGREPRRHRAGESFTGESRAGGIRAYASRGNPSLRSAGDRFAEGAYVRASLRGDVLSEDWTRRARGCGVKVIAFYAREELAAGRGRLQRDARGERCARTDFACSTQPPSGGFRS
jgi:hypothetical protein